MPRSASSSFWRGRPRSPSPCARRAPRSCRPPAAASGLISASVMSCSWNSRASRARIGVSAVELAAGDARRRDHLLGLEVGERQQVREVAAPHVVGVLLGHLLDVDPAHVAEQHQRPLARAVPDHARVVLLLDLGLRVDEHAARHVAADLELQDRLGVRGGLVGRVGELDAAGLHRPPVSTCDLITVGPPMRSAIERRLVGARGEAEIGDGDPGPLDDLGGPRTRRSAWRRGTLPMPGLRGDRVPTPDDAGTADRD